MQNKTTDNGDIIIQSLGTTVIRPNRFSNRRERVVKYRVIARSFAGEVRSQYCYGALLRDAYVERCVDWLNQTNVIVPSA